MNTEKWEKAFEYSNKVSLIKTINFVLHTFLSNILQVLQVQPDNAKALFRRGRACIHLNKVVEAKSDLKRALEINPDSKNHRNMAIKSHCIYTYAGAGIKKELAVLEKKTRELELKEQKLYSTMLGNQS